MKILATASHAATPTGWPTRASGILNALRQIYPAARTELDFITPFQMLVATILSAQSTDRAVNLATPALFERYPDAREMAKASPDDIEPFIRTIGLFHAKARHLAAAARAICDNFGGGVPADREALQSLPGVGRKTAGVVLANAFNVPAFAVDTHVGRLARRLGLSAETDPNKVEADLCAAFPEDAWVFMHHALILHGRRVCAARAPRCDACGLADLCPRIGL